MKNSQAIPDAVLQAFSIEDQPQAVQRLTGGTANLNVRVDLHEQCFVLRERSPRYSDLEEVRFEAACVRRLEKHGVWVPRPLPARDGEPFFVHNGSVYQLFPYIANDALILNEPNVKMAANTLAAFHNAMFGFLPSHQRNRPRYEHIPTMETLFVQILSLADDRVHALYAEGIRMFEQAFAFLREQLALDDFSKCSRVIIHGDWHPGNVGTVDKKMVVFDFDCMSMQLRIRDIADGLMFFCARRQKRFDTGDIRLLVQSFTLDPQRVRLFLDEYERHVQKPLCCSEWAHLRTVALARFVNCRLEGARKVPKKERADLVFDDCVGTLHELMSYTFR